MFVLALVLIYLVLAAQFESFVDPFVDPADRAARAGRRAARAVVLRQTLNIFSQIGLIMLVGLVTKNGILIVEFANQRRAAGAALRSRPCRKRPRRACVRFSMTTLATILGILPIALALGAGAESRISMGIAVIGGLLCGGAAHALCHSRDVRAAQARRASSQHVDVDRAAAAVRRSAALLSQWRYVAADAAAHAQPLSEMQHARHASTIRSHVLADWCARWRLEQSKRTQVRRFACGA